MHALHAMRVCVSVRTLIFKESQPDFHFEFVHTFHTVYSIHVM